MTGLTILGIVLFVGFIAACVFLFLATSNIVVEEKKPEVAPSNPDEVLRRCQELYDKDMHTELQRYAQRELAKNYGNVELRRILAKSLLKKGDEQLAIMHYEAILSITPNDTEIQEMLAQYYYENGPKNRSIELYEQILMNDIGNVNAVEMLCKLYEEVQMFDKAIEMCELMMSAEVEDEKFSELQYKIADLYIKIDDISSAFDAYEKIYKLDPQNLEIMIILADLAYQNKYWKDCLKYYNQIIEIVGDDFEILEKIAHLHVTLENWSEAVEAFAKLIQIEGEENAKYLYHQNEMCHAMIRGGQAKDAIDVLKTLLANNSKETSLAFTLAQAYSSIGEYQMGVNLYQKLIDDLPTDQAGIMVRYIADLICEWAKDLFSKGQYNQAFDKFFEALKYDEENDKVYFELGKCNYYIKSFQDAIAHFKRAIAIKSQESKYYFGLGCAYDESGQIKNAKIAFYDAININPMNVKARIAYAICLTKELEYAQAIEQFLEVLRHVPDNPDTLYNLALAYELVGDFERGIKYYKNALAIDKNHKEAKHNLELILGEEYIPESDDFVEEESAEENFEEGAEEISQSMQEENVSNENFEEGAFDFDIPQDNNQGSMFS